jgi:FKBP-type peptidyl-prolyl cis-trans isomerase
VEKKRAKEVREAKKNETSEGVQNAVGEADLLNRELKELKEERKRAEVVSKVEAKAEAKRAKKRAKDTKAAMKAEKQENTALEMQKIPKSRGVGWHKKRGKWQVEFRLDGKIIHGGFFDDHRGAVAKEQQLREHGQ